MSDFFDEIINAVKNDRRHNLKFEIATPYFIVHLMDDEDGINDSEFDIPIRYYNGVCDIMCDDLSQIFDGCDTGIEDTEIEIIFDIMNILKRNKKEIDKLLNGLNWTTRSLDEK